MKFTKTVEDSDYSLIADEVAELKDVHQHLIEQGVRIDIGHEHRFWEYGMALKALRECFHPFDGPSIADVGAGVGLLGPTISWSNEYQITELEPNGDCRGHRIRCNEVLRSNNKKEILWHQLYPDQIIAAFDVVFCISVIEHVAADHEFLKNISDMVKPHGLLFLTTDVMPIMPKADGRGYTYDNLREHNYTMSSVSAKAEYLKSKGFKHFGEVDLEYKGDKVFDYSFCSLAMVRNA